MNQQWRQPHESCKSKGIIVKSFTHETTYEMGLDCSSHKDPRIASKCVTRQIELFVVKLANLVE